MRKVASLAVLALLAFPLWLWWVAAATGLFLQGMWLAYLEIME